MNVIVHKKYVPAERTLEQAIKEKMQVLEEFYVVNGKNEKDIRNQLISAVEAEPDKDFDIVLDRVAHTMITKKLDGVR